MAFLRRKLRKAPYVTPTPRLACKRHERAFLVKVDSGKTVAKRLATDRAESADADIEMTRRKAFPAILRLRDRSYRKPIE